jgi:hypothetical protein
MKQLFTKKEYANAKYIDKLPCECYACGNLFFQDKKTIRRYLSGHSPNVIKYCSTKCHDFARKKRIILNCTNCGKEINKIQSQINKSKSINHFCSRSCSALYNNTHKTTGSRRSKLEEYLEMKLINLYPNMEIQFNYKNVINSELDIYIPLLKLGFELNGIYHYEPIYGQNKLNQIENNDKRKFQACLERGIELCIIDTSQQKYFKEKTSQKYLNIIVDLINERLLS